MQSLKIVSLCISPQEKGQTSSFHMVSQVQYIGSHTTPFISDNIEKLTFQISIDCITYTHPYVPIHLWQNGITVLDWLASSPYLGPIENCWDQLSYAVYNHVTATTTFAQLEPIAVREWLVLPTGKYKIWCLIWSMKTRVRECINANEGYTHLVYGVVHSVQATLTVDN